MVFFYQIDSEINIIMHFRNSNIINNAMITNKVLQLINKVFQKYQLKGREIKKFEAIQGNSLISDNMHKTPECESLPGSSITSSGTSPPALSIKKKKQNKKDLHYCSQCLANQISWIIFLMNLLSNSDKLSNIVPFYYFKKETDQVYLGCKLQKTQ